MVDVCNQCGLPQDLCVCEMISREQQKISVYIEKRKFGKKYTIIEGVKEGNDIVKTLKSKFACGGTAKSGKIELQGDHRARIRPVLLDLGFAEETLEIK